MLNKNNEKQMSHLPWEIMNVEVRVTTYFDY